MSSINWNINSPTRNREVGVIIENAEVADYFTSVFSWDWKNSQPVPRAVIGPNITATIGTKITLTGLNSVSQVSLVSYSWDVDGDEVIEMTGHTINWTYWSAGIYLVLLNITDENGNYATAVCLITVKEPIITGGEIGAALAYLIPVFVVLTAIIFLRVRGKNREKKT